MKRKVEGMVQTTIWLPQQMHQRLKEIGGAGGASEEIRRRLEASFEAEKAPKNPKNMQLLEAIAFVAEKAEWDFGNWSQDPFAFETLKTALDLWLTTQRPKGDPVMKPNPNREPSVSFFAPGTSAENIARFYLSNLAWVKREEGGKR